MEKFPNLQPSRHYSHFAEYGGGKPLLGILHIPYPAMRAHHYPGRPHRVRGKEEQSQRRGHRRDTQHPDLTSPLSFLPTEDPLVILPFTTSTSRRVGRCPAGICSPDTSLTCHVGSHLGKSLEGRAPTSDLGLLEAQG